MEGNGIVEHVISLADVEFDSDGFHQHLGAIQSALGKDDGGYASIWWSGISADAWADLGPRRRVRMVMDYIGCELAGMVNERMEDGIEARSGGP